MGQPDIQYFDRSGTWVKPDGAVRVDVVVQAAGGGAPLAFVNADGAIGRDGEISAWSIPADEIEAKMAIVIGHGGRIGGRDGYVLVITHVAEGAAAGADPA